MLDDGMWIGAVMALHIGGPSPPEEEITMLEAMKTVEKIRLGTIAQRIDVLRKRVET